MVQKHKSIQLLCEKKVCCILALIAPNHSWRLRWGAASHCSEFRLFTRGQKRNTLMTVAKRNMTQNFDRVLQNIHSSL